MATLQSLPPSGVQFRSTSLSYTDEGVLESEVQDDGQGVQDDGQGTVFRKVVSQNWYIPALTRALVLCALQIVTTQAQSIYCAQIWSQPQASKMFCWLWALAMVCWPLLAAVAVWTDIDDDQFTGDFALVPMKKAVGCQGKCKWIVHRGELIGCLFFLDLMNVPRDVKFAVVLVHPGGNNSRTYGVDILRSSHEMDARHRYVVVKYSDKRVHDFENTETSVIHFPLHFISAAMLYINLQNARSNQQLSWAEVGSLVLTFIGVFLKCWDAIVYFRLRTWYMTDLSEQQSAGDPWQQKMAARKLNKFWYRPAPLPSSRQTHLGENAPKSTMKRLPAKRASPSSAPSMDPSSMQQPFLLAT